MSETYAIKGAAIGRQPQNGPQRGEVLSDGTMYTLNTTEVHALAWTSCTEDFPARISAWPVSGPALGEHAAVSGLSSTGCCPNCGHDGRLSRMFPGCSPRLEDVTSQRCSPAWMNSGSLSHGEYWTHNTSESPNAVAACSLSAVLIDAPASKYWLSAKAARGILRRAERRGKDLPQALRAALMSLAGTPET